MVAVYNVNVVGAVAASTSLQAAAAVAGNCNRSSLCNERWKWADNDDNKFNWKKGTFLVG